jgi:peptide/nickel transport system substrate-binding protein
LLAVIISLLLLPACDGLRPSSHSTPSETPTIAAPAQEPTGTPAPPTTPTPVPAVLRIGWLTKCAFNPFAVEPGPQDTLIQLVFDSLVYRALDNSYEASLARAWHSNDHGLTWQIELATPVTSHDGLPLTTDDVLFTLQLFRGHPRFARLGCTASLRDVRLVDATTIELALSQPVAAIEPYLYWIPVLPRRVWQGLAANPSATLSPDLLVGSGPFRLDCLSTPERVILRANEGYRLGAPHLDTVELISYENTQALGQALVDGDVDLITTVELSGLTRLRKEPNVEVVSGAGMRVLALVFNLSPATTGARSVADPAVRSAIAQSIDRQQWVDLALQGQGSPGSNILPPTLGVWFDPTLADLSFDLASARQQLESAGYRDTDGDGIRQRPSDGKPLELLLYVPADPDVAGREADLLVQWLRQIGIRLTAVSQSSQAFAAAACPSCDYDLLLSTCEGGPDPNSYFWPWTSSAKGLNAGGYSSASYDDLYNRQAVAADPEQRRSLVEELQTLWIKERPAVALCYPSVLQAYRRDRFANWLLAANGALSLADSRSLLQVAPVD